MSWRFIFVVLLVAAGLSAWGGISLGNWLVSHGPETPPVPENLVSSDAPVLDADGRPYMAQPPQPLVNGQLGVPEPVTQIVWQLPEKSLSEEADKRPINIATTTISMDEARDIAEFGDTHFQGIANVGDLISAHQGVGHGIQPIDVPPPPPAPAPTQAAAGMGGDWQNSLRQEINACSSLNFFDRPSCAWAARNKYCGSNNAWGKTRDCPAKSF